MYSNEVEADALGNHGAKPAMYQGISEPPKVTLPVPFLFSVNVS